MRVANKITLGKGVILMLHRLKNLRIYVSGMIYKRRSNIKKQVNVDYSWYGNTYGGFFVHPNQINEYSIVYSFGIGEDISFDEDLINRHACTIYGFDPTPKSIHFVRSNQHSAKFVFSPIGIDSQNGIATLYLPKNKNHVSGSIISMSNVDVSNTMDVPMRKFSTIAQENSHTVIDVLKMDIEGAEYKIIDDILNSGVTIKQILIEFHFRFIKHGLKLTNSTIDKLNQHGYKIFAFSESLEEVSFIKEVSDNSQKGDGHDA